MSRLLRVALALVALASTAAAQPGGPQLTVQDVIARAVAQAPEIRAARAGLAESKASAEIGGGFRPSASVNTTPGYASGLPVSILGQVPAIGTVEAHSILFDRSMRTGALSAEAEIESAAAEVEARALSTAQAAAELYGRLAADQMMLASAERRAAALETIAARTNSLRNDGRARDLDVMRAELQSSMAGRRLAEARAAVELDELRLRRAIGWPAAEPLRIGGEAFDGVVPAADDLDVARRRDPSLRSLSAQVDRIGQAAALQKNLFQPTLAAQIQYARLFDRFSRFYLNFRPDDFSVGAFVTVPLWTGGRRAASAEKLTAQLQRLTAEKEGRSTAIEIAVREAEADVRLAMAERDLAQRARDLASEGLRLAGILEGEGRGEANDVPAAEAALSDAEDDLARATLHQIVARARLLGLRGELNAQAPGNARHD
jgi:outer membrane protein TolC